MKVICNQCGKDLVPLAHYCSWCGAQAPHKTVIMDDENITFQNPLFCPSCGKKGSRNALYCAGCGNYLYKQPGKTNFFCPNCKEKNNSRAKICISCGVSFNDWFSMKGSVAEAVGYRGNITLKETMNEIFYHFITDKQLRIGRNTNNDIVIPSQWVSDHHCSFNLKNNLLSDLKSRNGTYVNKIGEKIKSFSMSRIFEFNIAGAFTFSAIRLKNAFVFRLAEVLNQKEAQKNTDMQILDELPKHYFILLTGDTKIIINKFDGRIKKKQMKSNSETYQINVINNHYYLSDFSRKIDNQLILKEINNLPVNWKMIKK